MTRSVTALVCAGRPEVLSFRDLVVKRLIQAVLVSVVAFASFLAGTIISAIFFTGVEL